MYIVSYMYREREPWRVVMGCNLFVHKVEGYALFRCATCMHEVEPGRALSADFKIPEWLCKLQAQYV